MLKSLEKLRDSLLYQNIDDGVFEPIDTEEIAAEIQAEIDKYYKPLPLFEDGEPAAVGMKCLDNSDVIEIKGFGWQGDVTIVMLENGWDIILHPGDRLQRLAEFDSQEKIDKDFKKLKHEAEMNVLCSGVFCGFEVKDLIADFDAILARQRKLGGVE